MSLHDAEGGNKQQIERSTGCNTPCINDVLQGELLLEILHHLPAKLAVRCKLVCKRWFSIVSSSYFLRCFLMCHANEDLLLDEKLTAIYRGPQLLISPLEPGLKFSLDFLPCPTEGPDLEDGQILGSCDDLLLCGIGLCEPRFYCVCNPFTKKWVELPPPASWCKPGKFGLICDPYYRMDKQDVIINYNLSFKVVHITNYWKPIYDGLVVVIFSSETGKWIEHIVSFPQGPDLSVFRPILSFNMKMCWLAYEGVVIYDPNYEKIHGFVAYPEDMVQGRNLRCLGQCDGSLWLFQQIGWDLYIWQAKCEDNNLVNWSSKRLVNLLKFGGSNYIKSCSRNMSITHLLAIHPYDPNTLYFQCITKRCRIIASCDLKAETFEFVSKWSGFRVNFEEDVFVLMRRCWPTPIPTIPDPLKAMLQALVPRKCNTFVMRSNNKQCR